MLKNMKLGVKLVLVGGLLLAIPLAVVGYLASTKARDSLVAVEMEQYAARARLLAKDIDDSFKEEMKVATIYATDETIIAGAEAVAAKGASAARNAVKPVTDRLIEVKNDATLGGMYVAILSIGLDGVVYAASDPRYVGVSLADRDYVKQALSGKLNGGAAALDKVTGKPFTAVAAPVRSGDRVVGVYALVMDIAFVQRLVADEKVGERGFAFVIDREGMVLAHPRQDHIYTKKLSDDAGAAALQAKMISGENDVQIVDIEGLQTTVGYAPVPSSGWSVAVSEPLVDTLAESNSLALLIILISAAALVVAFAAFLVFPRTITKPLQTAVRFAEQVAAGDFTQQLPFQRRDEVGKLANALNMMSTKLSGMVATIQESAEQVAASSEQMSASAQSLSEGAQNQASTLEETSASVEELSASVDQVAEHAQSQASAVEQGSSSMTQVQKSMDDITQSMSEISGLAGRSVENALEGGKAVSEVVEGINRIAESSEKIAGIVTVIADIADQTNLLALNASIEAARAGEHGRGFAVVADAVSKLADRSAASTKEIEALIKESGKSVGQGVQTAKGSQKAMEQIREASQKVKGMIIDLSASMEQQVSAVKELGKVLGNVNEMTQSISAATEEQTTNARQVSKAVESVNELTQGAASAAEQMSSSTQQLSGMAQQLRELTAQFRIGRAAVTSGVNGGAAAAGNGSDHGAALVGGNV
jgi:methyl-accepting chemotaxis protein